MLTLVGTYGVLSLSVTSRRRELAIRAAVGAENRDLHKLIMGEGFRLIASGIGAGLFAAIAFSHLLRTFLFGVEPTDPLTLIGVGIAFAMVAIHLPLGSDRASDGNELRAHPIRLHPAPRPRFCPTW